MSGPSSGRARPASPPGTRAPRPLSRWRRRRPPPRPRVRGARRRRARRRRERHRQARGAAALVPVRERGERRRERRELVGIVARAPRRAARSTSPSRCLRSPPARVPRRKRAPHPSAPSRVRASTPRVRFPTSGGSEASHARCRASTSSRSRAPSCAMSERHRLRAIAVSSVQVPGGRPIHERSKAGSGSGISAARRNSNGAPSASPTASPRTQARPLRTSRRCLAAPSAIQRSFVRPGPSAVHRPSVTLHGQGRPARCPVQRAPGHGEQIG